MKKLSFTLTLTLISLITLSGCNYEKNLLLGQGSYQIHNLAPITVNNVFNYTVSGTCNQAGSQLTIEFAGLEEDTTCMPANNFEANFDLSTVSNGLLTAQLGTVSQSVSKSLSDPMITVWRVGTPGFGDGSLTLELPLRSGFNFDFVINWGDGTIEELQSPMASVDHSYASSGDYTVTIYGTIEAWYFNGDINNAPKLLRVNNLGDMGWTNLEQAFAGCDHLTFFTGGNTSLVTNMSYMFHRASLSDSIDVSSFDTSNVTNMSNMFYESNLTSIDVSNFNTSAVTDMSGMFALTAINTPLDLSSFDTSSVTTMAGMFNSSSAIPSLDLSSFDTSNVTDMFGMFRNLSSITSLDLSNFNTLNVVSAGVSTGFDNMFSSMSSLSSLTLSTNFNVTNATSLNEMFSGLTSLSSLDLSHFNTSNITNFEGVFFNSTGLTSLNLTGWDLSSDTHGGNEALYLAPPFASTNPSLVVTCLPTPSIFGETCN